MKNKDSVLIGLAIGVVVPLLGFVFVNEINELVVKQWLNMRYGFSIEFMWILSIAFNLIPFGILNRQSKESTARGLVYATVLFAGVIMVIFWSDFTTK